VTPRSTPSLCRINLGEELAAKQVENAAKTARRGHMVRESG
jgi:hypothetical protein